MTQTFDDFYSMAQEMIEDPETRSEASILHITKIKDPNKPWELESTTTTEEPVYCFYYKAKNNMVNGTVIQTGQKTVLVQTNTSEASLNSCQWKDHNSRVWVIKAVEPVELTDIVIYYKILLGD